MREMDYNCTCVMFSSNGLLKIAETGASGHIPLLETKGTAKLSSPLQEKQKRNELVTLRNMENKPQHPSYVRKVWLLSSFLYGLAVSIC